MTYILQIPILEPKRLIDLTKIMHSFKWYISYLFLHTTYIHISIHTHTHTRVHSLALCPWEDLGAGNPNTKEHTYYSDLVSKTYSSVKGTKADVKCWGRKKDNMIGTCQKDTEANLKGFPVANFGTI